MSNDELRKAELRGTDTHRALRNFEGDRNPRIEAWDEFSHSGLYKPTQKDMAESRETIDDFLAERVRVVVPMFEDGGAENHHVPREVLRYLVENCRIPRKNILVMDHRSTGKPSVAEAHAWNVRVINALEVMNCLDPKVLDVVKLDRLFAGKGIPMLAGLLALHAMREAGESGWDWVMFHDAELVEVDAYDGARMLTYPLVVNGDHHNSVLQAQVGRNNETVFAARVALEALEHGHPDPKVREYISWLRPQLLRLVWMLCGEFMVKWDCAQAIPLSDQYWVETLVRTGTIGFNHSTRNGMTIAQVVNPNLRADGANGNWAEQFMMNCITRGLLAQALTGTPPHMMTVEQITALNTQFEQMDLLHFLPREHGAVKVKKRPADRMLPSLQMLLAQGWVDLEKLQELPGVKG